MAIMNNNDFLPDYDAELLKLKFQGRKLSKK